MFHLAGYFFIPVSFLQSETNLIKMKRHGEDMALVLTEKRPRNELVSLEGDNSKQVASVMFDNKFWTCFCQLTNLNIFVD